jgi:polyphenol oxidase
VTAITLEAFAAPSIRHAFFTRAGGVSTGAYASLNCGVGSGDDPRHVAENRRRCAAALGVAADALVTCYQIHSAEAVAVEQPWTAERRPRADAMATRRPGVALGILTADCAPVLFADAEAGVIGAAHAGWRGALSGVTEAAVAAMTELGARRERVRAAIGPAIGPRSYEVGAEFPAPFLAEDRENAAFFALAPRPGHFLFDLGGYIARRLARLGLARIAQSGGDTAAEPDRFFSYRRACLKGEPDYGRGLSAICIVGSLGT